MNKQETRKQRLGYELKEYFLVSSRGFYSLIGASRGFNGPFIFNINRGRDNIRAVASDLKFRVQKQGSRIVDSDGNAMTVEDILDFAAYSRFRDDYHKWTNGSMLHDIIVDKDNFVFREMRSVHISNMIRNQI